MSWFKKMSVLSLSY